MPFMPAFPPLCPSHRPINTPSHLSMYRRPYPHQYSISPKAAVFAGNSKVGTNNTVESSSQHKSCRKAVVHAGKPPVGTTSSSECGTGSGGHLCGGGKLH
eukprot:Lankesteria_metandrocarpae@DN8777_c0_g1_i1.p1